MPRGDTATCVLPSASTGRKFRMPPLSRRLQACDAFHCLHQPKRVLAIDLADLGGGVTLLEQRASKIGPFIDAVEPFGGAADTVEVASQTGGINAGDLHDVI